MQRGLWPISLVSDNRLQRVQNTAAGYVYGRYAETPDVINLNWLPIEENIEMNAVKLAHKSLNDGQIMVKLLEISLDRT